MKLAHFILVLLVAIIALALGTGLLSQQQGQQIIDQQSFIESFDFSKVHRVVIEDGEQLVEINKQLEQWQIKQEFGYQADTQKLAKLLQKLKDAKIKERKTSNSKNYHRLGLADIDTENSGARLVTLTSSEGSIQVLLGAQAKSGSGQYAKLVSEPQTYLLDKSFALSAKASTWLNKDILSIAYDSVTSLHWRSQPQKQNEDRSFKVVRKELAPTGELKTKDGQPTLPQGQVELEPEFSLVDSTDKFKAQYPSIFSGLVRNTIQLELQRVLPKQEFKEKSLEPQFTIELNVKEQGLESQTLLEFYQVSDEKYWLTVSGSNWAYQISPYSYKQVAKPLSEYLAQ